jgi:hypothetical protein
MKQGLVTKHNTVSKKLSFYVKIALLRNIILFQKVFIAKTSAPQKRGQLELKILSHQFLTICSLVNGHSHGVQPLTRPRDSRHSRKKSHFQKHRHKLATITDAPYLTWRRIERVFKIPQSPRKFPSHLQISRFSDLNLTPPENPGSF